MYGELRYGDKRLSLSDYLFKTPETNLPRELVWGVLRDSPSPLIAHQLVVTELVRRLADHVRRNKLGLVCVSPIDVILDKRNQRPLVVQPDIIFIAAERVHILRDQVWGAPDLVVEVASKGTARRDRTVKLEWYRRYGVRECWLVDPERKRIELINPNTPIMRRRVFAGSMSIRSRVFRSIDISADQGFQSL